MRDLDKAARPAQRAPQDGLSQCGGALAQRALACELSGELDRAVALIRRLQHPDREAGETLLAVRVRAPA